VVALSRLWRARHSTPGGAERRAPSLQGSDAGPVHKAAPPGRTAHRL